MSDDHLSHLARCAKKAIATAVILGLFESLIALVCGGVESFTVSLTLTYLFSAKVTPPTKNRVFIAVFCQFVRKLFEILKLL